MDKPIIFNTSMVQALLAGRKTQTRRIVKAKSHVDGVTNKQSTIVAKKFQHAAKAGRWYGYDQYDITCYADSPYGEPGDLLWVRETLEINGYLDTYYVADNSCADKEDDNWFYKTPEYVGKVPAIHMRREASRFTLLAKDIRIERVQTITEENAITEGVEIFKEKLGNLEPILIPGYNGSSTCREGFENLWDSINKQRGYGWDLNPWVWVVEFKVIQQNIDQVSKTKKGIDLIKNLELVP